MKKALITGVSGQDGFYLSELLLEKGYEVHGIRRYLSNSTIVLDKRIKYYDEVDIASKNSISRLIREVEPDEIYHLAAYHFSSQNEAHQWDGYLQSTYT